jgi:mono/diheme cytochrome c family protein/plastocyanin
MMKRDTIALIAVLLVLVAFPAGLFGYQATRTQAGANRVIEIEARAPSAESVGFTPDHLELKAGETVRLRISSPDVLHGLSIPGLGVEVKEILPGKPVEVDVTPREPGRYAFTCIRWCSIDHWRMRGTIEVVAAGGSSVVASAAAAEPPLYQKLGINLDAQHPRSQVTPAAGQGEGQPSASSGAALGLPLLPTLADVDSRRAVSPAAAFEQMRADASNASRSDAQIWDLVAWAWLKDVRPESLAQAKALYSRDCAACHGPEGKGDGPAGRDLPGLRGRPDNPSMGQMAGSVNPDGATPANAGEPAGPANFTDASRILAMSDAALQGKILRGGMGTGMPEFGSLYTDDELWTLVAYIRTFVFQK